MVDMTAVLDPLQAGLVEVDTELADHKGGGRLESDTPAEYGDNDGHRRVGTPVAFCLGRWVRKGALT